MSITIIPDPLPEERRNDPKRQAEMSVLDPLARTENRGTAIYEWSAGPGSPEVDIALWVENLGRFAIQVKGGHYDIRDYNWFLKSPDGSLEAKPSPVVQTWDGAMSMRSAVETVVGFRAYLIPVLILPNQEPEPHVAALAAQKRVHLAWRGEDLMTRLSEIAETEGVHHPPPRTHIDNEVHAMMYGQPLRPSAPFHRADRQPAEPMTPSAVDTTGATVVINNYGPLIIHTGAAEELAAALLQNPSIPPPPTPTQYMPVGQGSENATYDRPGRDVGTSVRLPAPPAAPKS